MDENGFIRIRLDVRVFPNGESYAKLLKNAAPIGAVLWAETPSGIGGVVGFARIGNSWASLNVKHRVVERGRHAMCCRPGSRDANAAACHRRIPDAVTADYKVMRPYRFARTSNTPEH
jgi:hypothetical protein